jgi:hypothetical protein
MDAVVQLIRNTLCCVKDLNFFSESFLYDPSQTAKFYVFPAPHLSLTTPLELLISISQLYACISCSISGYNLIFGQGVFKLRNLNGTADVLKAKFNDIPAPANIIIRDSIMAEADSAMRCTMTGCCVLPLGIAFFWLFANSLHITAAGWIGGLPLLIHALTVMEVALLPLLYFMIKDANAALRKAKKIIGLAEKLSTKREKDDGAWLTLETFSMLDNDWTPYWSKNITSDTESKLFIKEIEVVQSKAKHILEKATLDSESGSDLEGQAFASKFEGYREYFYFILNFIAFYGYLLGIIVYYFDDDAKQPDYVRQLKLGYSNADADWTGNFAGDLMWTIEPLVILASPIFLVWMTNRIKKGKKVKSD